MLQTKKNDASKKKKCCKQKWKTPANKIMKCCKQKRRKPACASINCLYQTSSTFLANVVKVLMWAVHWVRSLRKVMHFCKSCGVRVSLTTSVCEKCISDIDVDKAISNYFHRGYPYKVIVSILDKQMGLKMCVRTLKRRLQSLGLKRKR